MYSRGFSLIELIIAMIIIGILAAIAYPHYQYHLIKGNRYAAEINLINIASRLEDFYTQNGTYKGATLSQLHLTNKKHQYRFQLTHLTTENYSIEAIPEMRQRSDRCGILQIDAMGHKTANDSDCW